MHSVVFGPDQGYLLSLATSRFALDRISQGTRAWWIKEVDLDPTPGRVLVRQRDDDDMQRLNDIGFYLPVITCSSATGSEEDLIVSLHAGNLDAEEQGLYISRKRPLRDCIADFDAFWHPLSKLLDIYAEDTLSDLAASVRKGGPPEAK